MSNDGYEGIRQINNERVRQIHVKGFTPEHDKQHDQGELLAAAYCYLTEADFTFYSDPPEQWPFEAEAWNPNEDIIVNLRRAGAFIAAEIDRIKLEREEGKSLQ